ncbi:transglycosylase SLT domain-containing protein [Burkholderia cepacia]|uniref:transglycosylase SLT domain-containing protein n=1 Tax=Burkholderia cepacia TaxID=292 RepID=UPI001CF0E308|nr:transglycosylase SLT domain-containing protein [Burkholderia cepacia]MCA8326133.1 lytic transglycosylase domain-containing protein [Burkholderia cepacia]
MGTNAYPAGYDPSKWPTSYKDPAYAAADQQASSAVGIPPGLLSAIRMQGERSNADQISSANAATPYQITPPTRDAILKQTGVDAYSSPQAAAYSAAYLLKQNLGRYGGDPVQAVAAYHGGTDQANWGSKTMAYAKRTTGFTPNSYTHGETQNPFGAASAPTGIQSVPNLYANQQGGAAGIQGVPNLYTPDQQNNSPLIQAFHAYQSGQMSPADKAQFEQDVANGNIALPPGMNVGAPAQQQQPAQAPVAPAGAVDAFNTGKMPAAEAAQFQKDVQSGAVTLPAGVTLSGPPPATPGREAGIAGRGFIQGAADTIGSVLDKAKGVIDMPAQALASIANGGGAANAIDQAFGTHIAPAATQANLPAATPQAAPNLPSVGPAATDVMNRAGMPTAVTPGEHTLQAAATGAGSLAVPMPGVGLSSIPKMIAAGAVGGAAGEAVHQATGSPILGYAVNLLTTALAPAAASRVVAALAKEVPAAGMAAAAAERAEPAMAAAAAPAAEAAAPAAAEAGAAEAAAQRAPQAAAAAPQATAEQAQAAAAAERMPMNEAPAAAGEAAPNPAPTAATSAAAPAEGVATAENAPTPAAAQEAANAVNPAASPAAAAARDFMSTDELAAQTRKATGASGAPLGIGKRTAQQTLAAQMAPDPERLAAAERLGIADNLQPDHLTTNQAAIELTQAIKSMPGSIARSEEMQGLQQVGQRAQKIVEDAAGTNDLSELSSSVKSELANTQQQLDQKAESLYSDLRSSVPAKMGVAPDNVLGFIAQRADELGGAKNLSPTERMIMSKLTPQKAPMMVGGQEVDPAALGLKPEVNNPSYALLDDVRKNIGAGLKNQGPFKDADSGLLKALYGRISEDQRTALANVPGALEKFDMARAAVQMRKSVEDDMTSLFGKQLGDSLVGKLGTAVTAAAKGDETKLAGLLKAVPQSMREKVMSSGLAYAFGKATKNGDLNFKSFADWYDGLKKNSAAHNLVMANLPAETRQQLIDLATVSRGVANATRENITTGRIMAAREALNARADGLMGNIYTVARKAAVSKMAGALATGAASTMGPIGAGLGHAVMSALSKGKPDVMKAADALIVTPEFQQLTRTATPSPQAIRAAANSPTFRRFYNLARDATAANDPNARERWLAAALSSSESIMNSKR